MNISCPPVDLAIITALRGERDAVKAVVTGAIGPWTTGMTPGTQLRCERRTFRASGGSPLHVALVCAEDIMGGTQSASVASAVVTALRPRWLAMSGVLAGKPGDTQLGDVVVADMMVLHDSGKRTAEGLQHSSRPHVVDVRWLEKLHDFAADPGDALDWLARPPWTLLQQRAWLLDQFARGRDVASLGPLLEECCPAYPALIRELYAEGLVRPDAEPLTRQGREKVELERFLNPRWPDLDPPRRSCAIHVGTVASGNSVQADPAIWRELLTFARKTIGIEMEAHAIGALAELHRLELALVMKGVMDRADPHKDDRFKAFAARASAECLFAFARRYMRTSVRAGYDDLLVTGTALLPDDPTPSQLLDARHEVVPWQEPTGIDVLAELDAWADDRRTVSACLVHAEGGAGKTRLAIEWIRRRREVQYDVAGFLVRQPPPDWFERLCGLGRSLVIVIDYAESRCDLATLLERVTAYDAMPGGKQRIRVLLLARGEGDWWRALRERSSELRALLEAESSRELLPMGVTASARHALFAAAVQRFTQQVGRATAICVPPLEHERFGRVLYVHMAALAAVYGVPVDATTLMDTILEHEERCWSERGRGEADDVDQQIDLQLARRLVIAATLRGGLTSPDARTMLGRLSDWPHERRQVRVLSLLHRIYYRPGESVYLPPLEPDLLGEGMLLRVALRERDEMSSGNGWDTRVFTDDDNLAVLQIGMMVLGRASANDPALVRPWLTRLLRADLPQRFVAALEAAKLIGKQTAFSTLGDVLADVLEQDGNVQIARRLLDVGFPPRSVSLVRVAEWAWRRVREQTEDDHTQSPYERAFIAHGHGWALAAAGQLNDACAAADEAVRHARLATSDDSVESTRALIDALQNFSCYLDRLGRHDESLLVLDEALRHYQGLTPDCTCEYRASLVRVKLGQACSLAMLGRRAEALPAFENVVVQYRGLLAEDSTRYRPELADALLNLGTALGEAGQLRNSLAAIEEAVVYWRSLADAAPDSHLPSLVNGLERYCDICGCLGMYEPAIAAAREAAAFVRKLAGHNLVLHKPQLARCLDNLGSQLAKRGCLSEAAEIVREAVNLHKDLSASNPGGFIPALAFSLHNLSMRYTDLGRHEEAMAAAREACLLARESSERNPAILPRFANCLRQFGWVCHQARHYEDALSPTQEAVEIHRSLALENPEAYETDLAGSLGNLGSLLGKLRRPEAALVALSETVMLYRGAAARLPSAHLPDLAICLHNQAKALCALGRHGDALAAAAESVEYWRGIRAQHPSCFATELAEGLVNLSERLMAIGNWQNATEIAAEAVELARSSVSQGNDAGAGSLARALSGLAEGLHRWDRHDQALGFAEEAVAHHRAVHHRQANADELAVALRRLSTVQDALLRHSDALASIEEASELLRGLGDARQGELAGYLDDRSSTLRILGRRDEALGAIREAVALRRRLTEASPSVHRFDLCVELDHLGMQLHELGYAEEALGVINEAIEHAQKGGNSGRWIQIHAGLLVRGSICLSVLGAHDEAVQLVEAALLDYHELETRDDHNLDEKLAMAFQHYATLMSRLGRRGDAEAAARAAAAHARRLDPHGRAGDVFVLAQCLNSLGVALVEQNRDTEADGLLGEAIAHYRVLVSRTPEVHRCELACVLSNYGAVLDRLHRDADSRVALSEAIALARQSAARGSDRALMILGDALGNLGLLQTRTGDLHQAIDSMEEAVRIRRASLSIGDGVFLLAENLWKLGLVLRQAGQCFSARQTVDEAMTLLWPRFEEQPEMYVEQIVPIIDLAAELHGAANEPIPEVLEHRMALVSGFLISSRLRNTRRQKAVPPARKRKKARRR